MRSLSPRTMRNLFLIAFLLCVVTGLSVARRNQGGGRKRSCTPQNRVVHEWTTFKKCSKPCGGGYLVQRRKIKQKPSCGDKACPYYYTPKRRRRVSCNTQCCPVHCLRKWNSWSPCQGFIVSQQTRTMRITRKPKCGGTACPKTREETRSCNTGK